MSFRQLKINITERIQNFYANEDSTAFPDSLFLELYQFQYEHNTAYRHYCNATQTQQVSKIYDIPSLPTNAFKLTPNPSSLLPQEIQTTFLTSGTTTDIKGSHHFASTATYEASILSGWKHCKLPPFLTTLILTPSASDSPHSSLSHMMQTIKNQFTPRASFILSEGQINIQPLLQCAEKQIPVTLLGTALAFLELFEALKENNLSLAEASWAMETGGYKGSAKSLTKEELHQKFQIYLGISSEHIWNEYSMTELSSQFYTNGIGNPHTAPPWTRIYVIDPETNLPVKPGEMGYLVIYDLANLDSVMGIRTQDLAIFHDSQSFTLIGRDPSALPRGCSRSF